MELPQLSCCSWKRGISEQFGQTCLECEKNKNSGIQKPGVFSECRPVKSIIEGRSYLDTISCVLSPRNPMIRWGYVATKFAQVSSAVFWGMHHQRSSKLCCWTVLPLAVNHCSLTADLQKRIPFSNWKKETVNLSTNGCVKEEKTQPLLK